MASWLKVIGIIAAAMVGLYLLLLIFIQIVSKRPKNLGMEEGKLHDCPDTNNCISTFASMEKYKIDPLKFDGEIDQIHKLIMEAIRSMPRTKIITEEPHYIYAEYRSLAWRFIDDVEVYIDADANRIHFRSASRIGTNDYGANRARLEELQFRLKQKNEISE